jgi:3-oxoacyl-[acyl-carrier protein] reductase
MRALEGRTALITGASRGIGAAIARRLSQEGARLALGSRSGADLGLPDALAMRVDVRDPDALAALADAAAERFGGLDVAIANAGVGAYGPFEEMALEHLDEMIDTNLKGTIHTARAALPHLVRSGAGDFVSIASEAGRRGFPGEAGYCASKFGQVGFTRALEGEFRERGVRCASICPGGVETTFGAGFELPGQVDEDLMRPQDIAEVVLHVLTRPRHLRILEVPLRAMTDPSWG